jgi:hypothetical protein
MPKMPHLRDVEIGAKMGLLILLNPAKCYPA